MSLLISELCQQGTAKVGFTVQGKWAATPPEVASIRLSEIEKGGSSVSVPAGRVEVEVGDVTPVAVLRAEVNIQFY